jgi:hypothetical protein
MPLAYDFGITVSEAGPGAETEPDGVGDCVEAMSGRRVPDSDDAGARSRRRPIRFEPGRAL